MSAEITQKLGFDTSDATKAIDAVNNSLTNFNKSLELNQKNLNRYVKNATKQLASLQAAAGTVGTGVGGVAKKTGGGGKSPVATNAEAMKKALPTLQQYADMIRKSLGDVPEKASKRNKRAIQNSIGSMAEMAKRYKLSEKGITQAFANTDKAVTGHARQLANAAQRINNNVSAAMKKAGGKLKEFTISWQTLGRVIMTQAIVRALSVLRNAIRAAIGSAIELGLRIAEIGTIAEGQLGSLGDINKEVVSMAKEFGRPVADVAEGLYQTISNQVGTATESLHVFRQANKLAIATNSTTADSVALLTAALNGFGLSANHAERVAGVLFTTIKQGRLRASELANILGRVAPLYAQMGGSIEEMSAALATMTVTGVKADTAVTQLRAIMIKLLKPSEDLKKVLKEDFGVDTAQAALVKFGGLRGLLEELSKQAGGSTQKMSEFFDRVRAIAGVLGLTNVSAKKFATNLEKIIEEQDKALSGAYLQVLATDAKDAETAINNLKTAVTEFGARILPIVTKFVSGLNVIATNLDQLAIFMAGTLLTVAVVSLTSATAATWTWAAAWAAVNAQGTIVLARFAPILPLIIAFGAGWWLGEKIKASANEVKNLRAEMSRLHRQEMEEVRKQAARIAEEWGKATKEKIRLAVEGLSTIARIQTQEIKQLEARNEIESDSVKRLLDRLVSARRAHINKIDKWSRDASTREQKRVKDTAKIDQKIEQHKFDKRLAQLSQERQARERLDRSRTLMYTKTTKYEQKITQFKDAQGKLLWTSRTQERQVTQESVDQRVASLAIATTEADSALQLAKSLGNRRLIRQAEAQQLAIMRQQNDVIKDREQLEKNIAAKLEDERAAAAVELKKALAAQADILAGLSIFDDDGELKSTAQQAEDAAKALIALATLKAKGPVGLSGLLDLADIEGQLKQFQTQGKPQIEVAIKANTEDFAASVKKELEAINPVLILAYRVAKFDVTGEAANLKDTDVARQLIEGSVGLQTEAMTKYKKAIEDSKIAVEQQVRLWEQIGVEVKRASDTAGDSKGKRSLIANTDNFAINAGIRIRAMTKEYEALAKEIKKDPQAFFTSLANERRLTEFTQRLKKSKKDVKVLADGMRSFGTVKEGERGKAWAKTNLHDVREINEGVDLAVVKLSTLRNTILILATEMNKVNPESLAKFLGLMAQEGLLLKDTYEPLADAGKSFSDNAANTVLPMQTINNASAGIAVSMGSAADSMQRMSNLAGGAQTPTTPRAPVTKSKGGLIPRYFADGGFARKGTDTVPAMLTPGEYVVNARSTRKFYSQLVAMNAGKQPIYRSEGGPVTNVGDINISVTGGTTDRESARNIVTRVRRELRRRSSTLG